MTESNTPEPKWDFDHIATLLKLANEGVINDTDLNKYKEEITSLTECLRSLMRMEVGPFISGVGKYDKDNHPETINVCYRFGVNYGGTYKLIHKGRTGQ